MKENYLSGLKSYIKYFKIISIFLFTLSMNKSGFGQTALSVGDISIVGFNSNNPDNFSFVCWVDLANNTKIKFTDNAFLSSGLSTATNNGRGGENFVAWTNNTGNIVLAGTVIKIENGTGNIGTASVGAVTLTLSGISNGGDQLFAYQGSGAGISTSTSDFGTNTNPSTFTGTILFGLTFASNWLTSGIATTNNSYLPSDLNVANGNLPIATVCTGGQYTGSRTNQTSLSAYRNLVNTVSNWTLSTTTTLTAINTTAFTLATSTPTITSTGTLNSVNTTYGTPSITPASFTASGSNLTNDILITPPTGYEVSKTVGGASGYANSQTLTQTSGTVANTTIYVRLKADATVAGSPYSGNIVLSSTGATSANVATISSTVSPKNLSITGISADNKTYDGTVTASLSGIPAYIGLENSETFSVSGTSTASFSTASVGNAKTVSVTGYTAPSTNYTVSQPSGSTASITPANLTVSGATVSNKIYDGNNSAILTGTLSGIIGSETVILNPSGTFTQIGAGTGLSITSTSTISGLDAGNYSLTQPTGLTADIIQKPLTITGLNANNKVFDGTTLAILSGTATLNGIIESDNVSISGTATATFDNRNIGTAKSIIITGYSLIGSQSGNYTISQPSGLTADITPLALSLNSAIAQNKPFDGNTNAVITGTLTGIISPDLVTLVGTGTFASSAIGDGIAVTSTSTLSGAGAGNYTLTQPIGLTADITGPPTIVINVTTTTNYIDGGILTSPISPYPLSGVINDPTDPAKTLGIDFTINDVSIPAANLIISVTSSNTNVVPTTNLNLTGSGNSRNLKITPIAEGFSTIVINVNNGSSTASYSVNYASSNASISPSTTRFHTGTADASTAQMIDNDLMIVADDENQALRLYNRQNSGLPLNSFNFTTSLGLTDISGGNPREVDIEASAKVGNRIYWMGSHSNASSGNNRPNRSRFFATDISGTGDATTLSYVGRFDNLKSNLLAWDANNGHGLGANFLGLAGSSATGKAPETADGSGFNIEGFEIAPNNTTAYICFRAPLQSTTTRTKALIIPLTNFADLVSGNPTSTTATFGNPIQLDLGGRAIREMKKNSTGEYLIIAGPHDGSTGIAPKDFRFYTWTGNPADAPILRNADLTALNANGSFESIVDLPSPLLSTSNVQVLVDNGDAIFYGNGVIAKDLPQNNHKKFRSELINLGTESLPLVTIKSITTGNWEATTTWNLGRIPQAGDLVIIDQNHEVSLNGTGNANKVEYQGTGKLKLNSTTSALNTGL